MTKTFVLLFVSMALWAEDKKPDPKPLPEVTQEQMTALYRAKSDLYDAEKAVESAQKAADAAKQRVLAAIGSITATCGDRGVIEDATLGAKCGPVVSKATDKK